MTTITHIYNQVTLHTLVHWSSTSKHHRQQQQLHIGYTRKSTTTVNYNDDDDDNNNHCQHCSGLIKYIVEWISACTEIASAKNVSKFIHFCQKKLWLAPDPPLEWKMSGNGKQYHSTRYICTAHHWIHSTGQHKCIYYYYYYSYYTLTDMNNAYTHVYEHKHIDLWLNSSCSTKFTWATNVWSWKTTSRNTTQPTGSSFRHFDNKCYSCWYYTVKPIILAALNFGS